MLQWKSQSFCELCWRLIVYLECWFYVWAFDWNLFLIPKMATMTKVSTHVVITKIFNVNITSNTLIVEKWIAYPELILTFPRECKAVLLSTSLSMWQCSLYWQDHKISFANCMGKQLLTPRLWLLMMTWSHELLMAGNCTVFFDMVLTNTTSSHTLPLPPHLALPFLNSPPGVLAPPFVKCQQAVF